MLKSFFVVGSFVFASLFSATSSADTISVVVNAFGSGSLGQNSFENRLFTITGVGDIDNVRTNGSVHTLLIGFETTIEIDGFDSAQFTDTIQAVTNNNSELGGFGNTSESVGLLFVSNEAFETFDLRSSLREVTGEGIPVFGVPHQTDAGAFRINSLSGLATFSATVESVPEPCSTMLFVVVSGLCAVRRHGR